MKAYSVPGLTNKKDLDIIYEWAKTAPENGVIVELGSMFGRTAVAFAEGAYTSVSIHCIDYFNTFTYDSINPIATPEDFWVLGKVYDKSEEFKKNTKDYPNIIQHVLDLTDKVYQYQGNLVDILFLDCSHRNPTDIMNLIYFKKFLKKNALICGHDYYPSVFPDIVKNVKVLESIYKSTVTLYKNSSMWSLRIKE